MRGRNGSGRGGEGGTRYARGAGARAAAAPLSPAAPLLNGRRGRARAAPSRLGRGRRRRDGGSEWAACAKQPWRGGEVGGAFETAAAPVGAEQSGIRSQAAAPGPAGSGAKRVPVCLPPASLWAVLAGVACARRRARSDVLASRRGARLFQSGVERWRPAACWERTLPGVRLPRVPGGASELPAPLRGTARPGPPCSAAGLALRSGRRAVHRARLCSLPGRHRCLPACAVTQFRVPRELRGASPSEIFTSGRDTALGSRLSVAQVERVAGEGGSSNCCCSDSVRPGKERLPCPTPEVQSTPAYALTRAMRKVAHLTWKEQRHTALNT